ncbi:MAG: hypothetical protein LBS25_00120 [Candidatus Symbiothrix sp.]|jgi:hypothetical protein|nr:hypothetical protein [Candidatus Symbiothrix sp.]
MITNNKIGEILEKYWQGQTSVEEERQLRAFFAGENLSEEFVKYRSMFVWENRQKTIQSTKNYRFTPRFSFQKQVYPTLKIAASVLILLAFGISVYTHYEQEKFMDTIFTETETQSSDSIQTPTEVVAKAVSPEWMQKKKIDNLPIRKQTE